MGTVEAATSPFAFTQLRALTARNFLRECSRRRVNWNDGQLESLHEAGLLVPLLSIKYDADALRQRTDPVAFGDDALSNALAYASTTGPELAQEALVGDLLDAASEPFRPWAESGQWLGEPYRHRQHLYSTYQLLMLSSLRGVTFDGHHEANGRISYRVRDGFGHETLRRLSQTNRELASLLTVLEFVYRPRVVRRFSLPLGTDEAAFGAARRSFDASANLAGSGWDTSRVLEAAEGLLHGARSLDPLDDWLDLVRQVHPSRWDKLKGDALLAIDHRVAAEILLLFYEDLVKVGVAEPLPPIPPRVYHPLTQRLHFERRDLDAVLSRYGISPYPPVLLALEGETEMVLAPRLLTLVAGDTWQELVELLDMRGVGQRLGHLAAYAIRPRLGDIISDHVELTRPPTRLVVAVDAEGPYSTPAKRQSERQNLVDRMFKALPREYRTPTLRRHLSQRVRIVVWSDAVGRRSFEFAHFTPRQLAAAIEATCGSPDVPDRRELTRRLARIQVQGSPIDVVWAAWRPPRPSKPVLAEYLWPTLESRAQAALDRPGYVRIPVLRAVMSAVRSAGWPPRHGQAVLPYRARRRRPLA